MAGNKKAVVAKEEVSLSPMEVGTTGLAQVMEEEAGKRKLITQYISKHMTSGADYGTIKFGGKESKPSLFKPGSEKFLSLFKLTARFEKDTDTWEMAGSENGVFAYKCLLMSQSGAVVGEGRGVSKLTEKAGWTINNAVKIAEKRAQIDAVLRTGALSDFFTQDLEDMTQYDNSAVKDNAIPVVSYDDPEESVPKIILRHDPIDKTIAEQRREIFELLKARKVDITDGKACNAYVADETQLELKEKNFAKIIELLK